MNFKDIFTFAKYEFLMKTSTFKGRRWLVPAIITLALVIYYIILDFFLSKIELLSWIRLFVGVFPQAFITILELVLFWAFLYAFIYPITMGLKDLKVGQIEIIKAAPVKPGDFILGQFIGSLPLILLFSSCFSILLTTILSKIIVLSLIEYVIFYLSANIMIIAAYWMGQIIGNYLQIKLGARVGGKDLAKAFNFIFGILIVAAVYSASNMINFLMENQEYRFILAIFPSTWVSKTIEYKLGIATWLDMIISNMLLVTLFVFSLALGYFLVSKFYSMEVVTFNPTKIKKESILYKIFGKILGVRYKYILLAEAKNYFRKTSNIAKLGYLFAFIVIYLFSGLIDITDGVFIIPIIIAPMIGFILTFDVTIDGKEILQLYKKAPNGAKKFVLVKTVVYFTLSAVISLIFTLALFIYFQVPILSNLVNIFLAIWFMIASTILALSISFINPAFSQKSPNIGVNTLIYAMIIIFFFIMNIFLYEFLANFFGSMFPDVINPLYFMCPTITGISLFFELLGIKRLEKIE